MGLATVDPHSQKEHAEIHKFGVNQARFFFVNFGVFKWLYLAYFWVYLQQTWKFCKAWSALNDYVDQQLQFP